MGFRGFGFRFRAPFKDAVTALPYFDKMGTTREVLFVIMPSPGRF